MNYRFHNLLGAPYRGGNAAVVNNNLLVSPVGNRVSVTDLLKSETITLPCEASTNLRRIAASPDGVFLLTIDDNNRCLFINLPRRAVLHRISFKHPVAFGVHPPMVTGTLQSPWKFYSAEFQKPASCSEIKFLQKAVTRLHQDLADTCSSNEYMIRYLCSTSNAK